MSAIVWAIWIAENLILAAAVAASVVKESPLPAAILGGGLAIVRLAGIVPGLRAGRARGRDPLTSVILVLLLGPLSWARPPRKRGKDAEKPGPCAGDTSGL